MNKQIAALAAALILAAPLAANAQDVPSYAASDTDQQIHGRIANFDGGYNLQVRDANGYIDNVELHDGTIINPTGLSLAPGMVVSIDGFNSGSFFDANEIDTPYSIDAGVPFYEGHAWDYYGPSISLDFFFGSGGWWHGGNDGRGYAYNSGVRVDNYARVENNVRVDNDVRVQNNPRFNDNNVHPITPRQTTNVQNTRSGFAPRAAAPVARFSGNDSPSGGNRASGGGGNHERR
jgi:hypothetical protein